MKKIRKILLVTTSMLALSTSHVVASPIVTTTTTKTPILSDLKVKLSAFAHFQAGLRNQSNLAPEEKNVSAHRKNFAFFNEVGLSADISNEVNGVTYGGNIFLVPTAKRKASHAFNGSHIYMQSEFGRFEAGSPIDAAGKMYLDGYDIIAAHAVHWNRYASSSKLNLKQGASHQPSFASCPDFFLDSKLTTDLDTRLYSNEPSRKISYYTPKFNLTDSAKISLGISFIPDSSNTGADNIDKKSSGILKINLSEDKKDRFEIDRSVKNAISGGISVEKNITDGVDLKVALTGEYGKSAGNAKRFKNDVNTPELTYKLKDLRTYNIGAVLTVGNFSYGGSFGSLGKSLTTPEYHKAGRNTTYYTGAVAYTQGPFKTSISYFKSNQYKNTVDTVSIGTDYLMAPGFKPYAEISGFSLNGKPEFHEELQKKKTRGTVALIGAKLSL